MYKPAVNSWFYVFEQQFMANPLYAGWDDQEGCLLTEQFRRFVFLFLQDPYSWGMLTILQGP